MYRTFSPTKQNCGTDHEINVQETFEQLLEPRNDARATAQVKNPFVRVGLFVGYIFDNIFHSVGLSIDVLKKNGFE
jgi:hypothetical protein